LEAQTLSKLKSKVVFITGGARGLGRSYALTVAAEGADVVVVDICRDIPGRTIKLADLTDLERTVADVQALGVRALGFAADVRSSGELQTAVDDAIERLGGVDVLVANAGIGAGFTNAWEISEDDWNTVIEVNLKGAWLIAKLIAPHMIGRGSGRIIFISSQAGLKGYPGIASYCAAKFGVIGLMKSLAIELAPHGINVNAVCPGSVDTEGNRGVAREMGVSFEDMVSAFTSKQLISRVMPPEYIARAIVYLASSDGDFITGHALAVDGGAVTK
jgi:NAD(P)-dependent dehydrogenase (short-subunit alcohol dehydrogenase family)